MRSASSSTRTSRPVKRHTGGGGDRAAGPAWRRPRRRGCGTRAPGSMPTPPYTRAVTGCGPRVPRGAPGSGGEFARRVRMSARVVPGLPSRVQDGQQERGRLAAARHGTGQQVLAGGGRRDRLLLDRRGRWKPSSLTPRSRSAWSGNLEKAYVQHTRIARGPVYSLARRPSSGPGTGNPSYPLHEKRTCDIDCSSVWPHPDRRRLAGPDARAAGELTSQVIERRCRTPQVLMVKRRRRADPVILGYRSAR